MKTTAARPIEACLLDLFRHLGIERTHIAAGGPPPLKDWHSLATFHPERVASLTLISPPVLDTAPLAGLASRILVVAGDQGALTHGAVKFANNLSKGDNDEQRSRGHFGGMLSRSMRAAAGPTATSSAAACAFGAAGGRRTTYATSHVRGADRTRTMGCRAGPLLRPARRL